MRWLIATVLGVLVVALVALAWVLLPAHLQIRRVAPPLPDEQALRALAARPDGPVRLRYAVNASQPLAGRTIGHSIFVIEWADGRSFVVDAGMDRETATEFGELMATLQDAGEVSFGGTIPDVLGDGVERVEGVGFTHLHVDHVQGVEAFCAARGPGASLYQTSWQAGAHNLHTEDQAALLDDSCLEQGQLTGDVVLTADAFPGLGIVRLGGHTPGSTLFVVPIGGRLWLLSGDISNAKSDLLANRGKGFAYSYLLVPEDTARTEALRIWLADLDARPDVEVVVSHDLEAIAASGLERIGPPGAD